MNRSAEGGRAPLHVVWVAAEGAADPMDARNRLRALPWIGDVHPAQDFEALGAQLAKLPMVGAVVLDAALLAAQPPERWIEAAARSPQAPAVLLVHGPEASAQALTASGRCAFAAILAAHRPGFAERLTRVLQGVLARRQAQRQRASHTLQVRLMLLPGAVNALGAEAKVSQCAADLQHVFEARGIPARVRGVEDAESLWADTPPPVAGAPAAVSPSAAAAEGGAAAAPQRQAEAEYDAVVVHAPRADSPELGPMLAAQRDGRLRDALLLVALDHATPADCDALVRLGATGCVVRGDDSGLPLAMRTIDALDNLRLAQDARVELEALQASEERLSRLMQANHDAPWDMDLRAQRIWLSPQWWTMLGYPLPQPSELSMEQMFALCLPPEQHEAARAGFEAIAASRELRYELQSELMKADGSRLRVLTRGFIVRDAQGVPERIAGTNTDISERLQTEAALRAHGEMLEQRVGERTQALEAANRELEAFAASVAHDLRAPLRSIDGLAQLIQRNHGAAMGDPGVLLLGMLMECARRMDAVIIDLLAFSRSTSEALVRGQVPLSPLVQHCLDELRPRIQKQGVTVSVAPLPQVWGDVNLLRLVVANLLDNAVKYTRPVAEARISVTAETDAARNEVVLCVADNGVGFDMDDAGKLFDVFHRLPGAKGFEGNGVGLASAARIVARHGGRIWADAAPGQGARFYVALPLQAPEAGA